MWTSRYRRVLRDEDGFAMIVTMVVGSIMMLFTVGMLATGLHLTDASVRDQRWNTALQVAEAGVDRAAYEVSKNPAYAGSGTGVLDVPGGQVEILVDHPSDGRIVVYSTGWVPDRTATNRLSRRIKVEFGPQDTFSYALFSETGLFVKNNAGIVGDVFANDGVAVDNNAIVYGSVTSATEGIEVGNNAVVSGDLRSGGPAGIIVNNNALVEGGAYALSTSCAGVPGAGEYDVTVAGTVEGDAVAWGSISGNVLGSRTPSNCQLAEGTKTLPLYTWDPTLFTGEIEYTTVASFETFVRTAPNSLSGVHHVWVDACAADPGGLANVIDMGATTVVDDFVLVTNCRVDMNNNVVVSAPDDAVVDIVVLNPSIAPPAVHIKNNFEVLPNHPAVLLYSTGLIEVKNNGETNGAVYAGAISIKNNLEVTYDARVERTLGFGDMKFDRMAWIECEVGTTGTGC